MFLLLHTHPSQRMVEHTQQYCTTTGTKSIRKPTEFFFTLHSDTFMQLTNITFPAVIFTPLNPLQITLYLSYPMTTMERIEMVPKIPPSIAYTLHPSK